MKQQIRQCVFETNSSSVHTVSIYTDENCTTDYNGEYMTIEAGQFGWEYEQYTDLYSKLSYLYTAYLDFVDSRYVDEESRKEFEWFIPVIKDLCEKHNLNIEFVDPEEHSNSNEFFWYYVDHCYDLKDLFRDFEQNNNLLESFLFNDKSEVMTGNDNDGADYPAVKDDASYTYVKTN